MQKILAFCLCCGVAAMSALADEAPVSQLSVRGEAILNVSPDQVMVNLGVTSEANTAQQALSSNNDNMNAMMRALKKLGLGKDEYKTQQFQVHPMWSRRPRNPAPEWGAKIIGYRVTNSLQVRTQKMQLAGDIIGAAMSAGANTVNSVQFGLADAREFRAQAIKQAMENAQTDAQTLAAASGDKIKRTLSLNLDNAVATPMHVQPQAQMMGRAMAMDGAAPPIEAGDVNVQASVSVIYELE